LKFARVPDKDRSSAIISLRDDPFEIPIFEGMILHHDREPFFQRVHGRSLWNGPGLEDPGDFEPKIVVKTGGVVFMDDKSHILSLI
jgi:hypothetical protein